MTQKGDRVRVFVADDHPLFREGVVRALRARAEFDLVGEAGDGDSALEQITELEPDVAVLDLRLPGRDGIEIVEALARAGSATRVIILSAVLDSSVVFRAVGVGAAGYLSKDAERAAVCDAVAAVAAGESVIAPQVQSGLADEIRAHSQEDPSRLSPREHEVLRLTAEGLSGAEIAERLFVSRTTVKTHLQRLYEKLGVDDRAAAVAEAMRRGLLD